MKVSAEKTTPAFQPITVTITLETREEFRALQTLASKNYSTTDAVRNTSPSDSNWGWDRETLASMLAKLNYALGNAI